MTPEEFNTIAYFVIAALFYLWDMTKAYINNGYKNVFGHWSDWDEKIFFALIPSLLWPITTICKIFCAIHRRF